MKPQSLVLAAALFAIAFPPTVVAGPQYMTQTVDAQGKALPTKPEALKSAVYNWQKRVQAVDQTYADHTKAQNWTVNYRQSGSDIVANVAGIPCQ